MSNKCQYREPPLSSGTVCTWHPACTNPNWAQQLPMPNFFETTFSLNCEHWDAHTFANSVKTTKYNLQTELQKSGFDQSCREIRSIGQQNSTFRLLTWKSNPDNWFRRKSFFPFESRNRSIAQSFACLNDIYGRMLGPCLCLPTPCAYNQIIAKTSNLKPGKVGGPTAAGINRLSSLE